MWRFVFLIGALVGSASASETLDVVALDRGWVRHDGLAQAENSNFTSGIDRTGKEFHDWFAFDLSSIEYPVLSMSLVLRMPYGHPDHPFTTGGYRSEDPSELFELRSFDGDPKDLLDGLGGVDLFAALASGVFLGERLIEEADEGFFIEIPLNAAAVASANIARTSGELWAIGGNVPTTAPGGPEELIFAGSHTEPMESTFVSIVVPAPFSGLIFASAFFGRRPTASNRA